MAADSDSMQAIEKAQATLDAFVSRYQDRNGEPQFDIDVMRRAKIVDATMAGSLTVDIELGYEYSNSARECSEILTPILQAGH
ncbi:hypothetical protein MMC17_006609 [Xylographa soralifera]|nr:hypothetical protein [Xylographa soralifera]